MKYLLDKKLFYLFVAMFFGLIASMRMTREGLPFFDIQFFYFPADVHRTLESIGEMGRQKYALFNELDFCFTIVYSYLLFFIYKKTLKEHADKLLIMPVLLFLFDIGENSSVFYLLRKYPSEHVTIDTLLSIFTPMKWFFALAACLIVINAFVIRKFIEK